MSATESILQAVLAKATTGTVVVFDLDSTLLDNRPRQAQILREFGVAKGVAQLAASRAEDWTSWSIGAAMVNAGVPAAEAHALRDEAKDFWRDRFFTSEYCELDDVVPGAPDYVRAIAAGGAVVAYCTGRHEAMRPGTEHNLLRHGFPLAPHYRAQLVMKPTFEISDDGWKESAYSRLSALGMVIAAFDNEPTHINGYRRAFPDAVIVHLLTDDSGRGVKLIAGIVSVTNFR